MTSKYDSEKIYVHNDDSNNDAPTYRGHIIIPVASTIYKCIIILLLY